MKLIGAHLPQEEIDEIDKIANDLNVPRTIVIRWALSEYVKRFSSSNSPFKSPIVQSNEKEPSEAVNV